MNQDENPTPSDKKPKKGAASDKKKTEKEIDEEIEQSFPASDPPSYSMPGNDKGEKKQKKS
ncbi:hypothetical protein [Negadavirga shengliensis]|uniref:Uncharacterized protein n=1 Tax=Negadavirga shengliensis TaxID=1389218 RepID=A0ABV9T2A8_9BACT